MYINVKIGEAYYLQMSGVLRCEAGRVFTLVTVAWLIDCQCLVRLQGDTVLRITEHFFVWTHLSRGFWLGYIWSILNCIWSQELLFKLHGAVRCRISYIPSLPISPFCLLFAKSKKAMYNVWGWGGPLLELKCIYHFFQSLRSVGF